MRGRNAISDLGPMVLADGLKAILPAMAKLAKHGLQIGEETPKLVFDEDTLVKAGILGSHRK